jgi:hypothetical protein
MDEWKKKMYYIFTMEYYSTTKKNKIVICREMDETREHVK